MVEDDGPRMAPLSCTSPRANVPAIRHEDAADDR